MIDIAQAPSDSDGNEQFYILQFDAAIGAVHPRHPKSYTIDHQLAVVPKSPATMSRPS